MKLFDLATKQGEPFEQAIQLPMKAVLVSPHFLYRIEDDPKNPNDVRTLNDFEFATRLSYFLWSSMPDEELFTLAEKGELRKPGVLEAQVKRMLKDPKAKALSENFAGAVAATADAQDADARTRATSRPGTTTCRTAMVREAELFFEYVVQNDRSILDFLDADYTFVNDRLARHYGIANVNGLDFRKVKLPDGRRGGVLTMASMLTVTSNPTRTSPVKRGKWILENILGTPPPPPAPDVPELPPTGRAEGHAPAADGAAPGEPEAAPSATRSSTRSASASRTSTPSAAGGPRTTSRRSTRPACCPAARSFTARRNCGRCCLGRPIMFRRCFAEKLLTFALGRGLEYYDKCALDEVATRRQDERRLVLRPGARDREVRPVPEAERQTERIAHDDR